MGKLTTHVLDLVSGYPGRGIDVELYFLGNERNLIRRDKTNSDGRCDTPLAEGDLFQNGTYELVFHAGAYHDSMDMHSERGKFLDEIIIRINVADSTQHYHVPLLLSAYGYSTYRGS